MTFCLSMLMMPCMWHTYTPHSLPQCLSGCHVRPPKPLSQDRRQQGGQGRTSGFKENRVAVAWWSEKSEACPKCTDSVWPVCRCPQAQHRAYLPFRIEWWVNKWINLHLICLHIQSIQRYTWTLTKYFSQVLPLTWNFCLLTLAWLGLLWSRANWVLSLPESLPVIPANSACSLSSLSPLTVSPMFGQSLLPFLFLPTQLDYKHLEDKN